jgi:hypothetical protein
MNRLHGPTRTTIAVAVAAAVAAAALAAAAVEASREINSLSHVVIDCHLRIYW